jgi:uncharacterized membrane protein YkoI
MTHDKSSPFVLGAVLALVGTGSFAQTAAQQPNRGTSVQTSLAQAIRVAEQETGGRARKAEMERDRGVDAYEIKTVSKDMTAKVLVDPASGKVTRVDKGGFFGSLFDRDDRREDEVDLALLEASPMTIEAASLAVERETGGRAVEASVKSHYGQTLFEVGVVKDLALQRVMVDPTSGKVVALEKKKQEDID